MSRFVFKMPDLGEGTVSAEVVEWKVKVGDAVKEDQIIAEVMTDKAAVEIPAPVSGRVVAITGQPGDMVAVGSELIAFDTSGAAPAETPAAPAAAAKQPAPAARPRAGPAPAATRRAARDGVPGHAAQGACRRRRPCDGQRHRPRRAHFRAGHRVGHRRQVRRGGQAGRARGEKRHRGNQGHRRAPRDRGAPERRQAQHPALRVCRGSGRHGTRVPAPVPERAPAEGRAVIDLPAVPGRCPDARAGGLPPVQRQLRCRAQRDRAACRRPCRRRDPDTERRQGTGRAQRQSRSLADLASEIRRVSEAARSNGDA